MRKGYIGGEDWREREGELEDREEGMGRERERENWRRDEGMGGEREELEEIRRKGWEEREGGIGGSIMITASVGTYVHYRRVE